MILSQVTPVSQSTSQPKVASPRHNQIVERLLGAKLRNRTTGEVRTVTGVRYSEDNADYVAFELDHFPLAAYSFGALMRDYVGEEGRDSERRAMTFNRAGVKVVSLFDAGNITLPRQFPRLANVA